MATATAKEMVMAMATMAGDGCARSRWWPCGADRAVAASVAGWACGCAVNGDVDRICGCGRVEVGGRRRQAGLDKGRAGRSHPRRRPMDVRRGAARMAVAVAVAVLTVLVPSPGKKGRCR
jgi:hypothetical protein